MGNLALKISTILGYGIVILALVAGWRISEQRYLVPDDGIGYWLGIIGGSMMMLLLFYPARKKRPRWSWLGSVKIWFRLHMLLGILGPTLIVFHANYQLGSLNSRVAFFSMVIVASSGLIGRYLYRRIHHGLYGKKIEVAELYPTNDTGDPLPPYNSLPGQLQQDVETIEAELVNRHTGINRSLSSFIGKRWRLRRIRNQVRKLDLIPAEKERISQRIWQLRSICNLGMNEIIFSYWHILHFPLFITLVLSGITHVIVVHFY